MMRTYKINNLQGNWFTEAAHPVSEMLDIVTDLLAYLMSAEGNGRRKSTLCSPGTYCKPVQSEI